MATVPLCASGNAPGTTLQDYVTALYNALVAQPGDFAISNVVGGGTPTSWTLTHSDGWQINYRVSGGVLLSLIAPSGGIANSASPGTPTNAYAEDTLLPAPTGTSTRWQYAQYGDAIFFAINGSANTFTVYAIHQGKIRLSNNGASTAQGLGTLAYLPSDSPSSTAFTWYSQNGTANQRKSKVRYSTAGWGDPTILQGPGSFWGAIAARLGDLPCSLPDSGSSPNASSALRGLWRYLRVDMASSSAPLSVLPSDTTNQGWLRLSTTTSLTRHLILWDKTVTP